MSGLELQRGKCRTRSRRAIVFVTWTLEMVLSSVRDYEGRAG